MFFPVPALFFALNTAWLAPHARSLLRIAAGLAFLEHGTGKLAGLPRWPPIH